MHLSLHKIDELKNERENGRAKYHKGVFYYVRRFWYLYPDNSGERESIADWHIATILRKPTLEFAIRFHVGNAGSETPFDGHLKLFGSAVYWGISMGRELAQKITETPEQKYGGRDISIWNSREDDHLYVTLWRDSNSSGLREKGKNGKRKRDWRNRSYRLNPMEWIYGPYRYSYKDMAKVETEIEMPEGSYPVTLTLREVSHGRSKSKQQSISYCVDINADKGIPTHYDSSGGWKGDRSYGFGVDYPSGLSLVNWADNAKNLVKARVYKDRGRTGFTEPQEVD